MKLYHYVLAFFLLLVIVVILADVKTQEFKTVVEDKQKIETNLDKALDDGVGSLVEIGANHTVTINKDIAVKNFFMSLYSSFGVISDDAAQEKLNLYIPVIAITGYDGYNVYHYSDYTGTDGMTYAAGGWSENLPYYYEDPDFIYGFHLGDTVTLYDKDKLLDTSGEHKIFTLDYHDLKTDENYSHFRDTRPNSFLLSDELFEETRNNSIKNCLENSLGYYTSRHNEIAQRYGITYNFTLPQIEEAISSEKFYIEKHGNNLIYHTATCAHLLETGIEFKDGSKTPYYGQEACLAEGAYPCPDCIEPSYSKYFEAPSMFVLFQGYPYGSQIGEVYNRFLSAGSEIIKDKTYRIVQKDWYYVYHLSTCPLLNESDPDYIPVIFKDNEEKIYYRPEDCITQGAYACPVCIKNGAYAPSYSAEALKDDTLRVIYSVEDWDSEKISLMSDIHSLVVSDYSGILLANINGTDPYFCLDYPVDDAAAVKKIRVYARITENASSSSKLYFASSGDEFAESKCLSDMIKTDNTWQWIEFPVSNNIYWTGSIEKLRFDITDDNKTSGSLEISEIQFLGK